MLIFKIFGFRRLTFVCHKNDSKYLLPLIVVIVADDNQQTRLLKFFLEDRIRSKKHINHAIENLAT